MVILDTTLSSQDHLSIRRDHPTIWGMSADEIHERFWASRRIQVIRQGERQHVEARAELYLLARPNELLLFDPLEAVKRLRWLNGAVLRLRVVDAHLDEYAERIVSDADGGFIRTVRRYSPETQATTQAWLTARASVARAWANVADAGDAKHAVQRASVPATTVPHRVTGHVFSALDQESARGYLKQLIQDWQHPGRVIDGVYQYAPGVWVQESSDMPEDVQVVPPVWIGMSKGITTNDLYVGPLVIVDDADVMASQAPVDWNDLTAPEWRLMPPLGQRPGARFAKRAFDILFSAVVLLLTGWLYPLIILVILLEDGRPVFFAHRRQTIGGKEFPCYKFRTMRKDAEQLKAQLQAANQADGPQFFIENDPRLLRCGRALRKLQLDEIPQFWNVLVGHMSVVGPRPSPEKENQFCPAWREARLSVRPGVTGLWQVSRTREPQTDFQEWIKYDLEYVQRSSLRLDVWIILNTFKTVIGH